MQSLESACQQILAVIQPLGSETLAVRDACGRILASDVVAPLDLPPFDNSAMDGYAVRALDTAAARADAPVHLKVVARLKAGGQPSQGVESGQAARIFTGAPLPPGADAVVMQEDTQTSGDDGVLIGESIKPWENVRFCGEDVKRGTTVIDRGQPLTAAKLGLIAALGISSVAVGRRPTVGLIATGTELIEPGESLVEGQIYESNRTTLRPLLMPVGADCRVYPLVRDSMEATTAALEMALAECDAVVTSGGVSVGELDFVKAAFEALGGRLEFWKVAIRPGKPFVFGQWRDRFLFGLPGNPVSALVTAFLLVRPAILRWQGALHTEPNVTWGILDEALANPGDRRHFVRVQVTESGRIRSAGLQASHVLASLARADGLVDVPAGTTLMAGTPVAVMRLA